MLHIPDDRHVRYPTKPTVVVSAVTGDDIASVVHISSGEEAFRAKPMDKIWVELAASDSTAHGPSLRIRLVADQHPAVQAASQAMQAASEADYAQRAERALKQPIAKAPRSHEVGSLASLNRSCFSLYRPFSL